MEKERELIYAYVPKIKKEQSEQRLKEIKELPENWYDDLQRKLRRM